MTQTKVHAPYDRQPISTIDASGTGVFARDHAGATHAYTRLAASAAMPNDHAAFRVDRMPFAGLRRSGLGVGGIPCTCREAQIEKMFVGPMP
jgi:acyl-CoA reductase-like NAD-dependent aldehyde dehydrogenase